MEQKVQFLFRNERLLSASSYFLREILWVVLAGPEMHRVTIQPRVGSGVRELHHGYRYRASGDKDRTGGAGRLLQDSLAHRVITLASGRVRPPGMAPTLPQRTPNSATPKYIHGFKKEQIMLPESHCGLPYQNHLCRMALSGQGNKAVDS